MDFIKKHWEKVLLGVVLVGLTVAVAFLPLKIASERADLEAKRNEVLNPNVKELPPLDLAAPEAVLNRTASPLQLDFSTGHRLFNPVLWQKTTDNRPLKVQSGNEVGPAAVEIQSTTPLYTIISFDNVVTNESSGPRYAIGVERQAAPKATDRRKRQTYTSVDTQTEHFKLLRVVGQPSNPEALILEVTGTDGEVRLTKDKNYQRVDGHMADLKYAPETRTWLKRRVGDKVVIAGEEYNIVAINETEVVFSAPSGKKTSVQMTTAK